jgi:hypothetical protein
MLHDPDLDQAVMHATAGDGGASGCLPLVTLSTLARSTWRWPHASSRVSRTAAVQLARNDLAVSPRSWIRRRQQNRLQRRDDFERVQRNNPALRLSRPNISTSTDEVTAKQVLAAGPWIFGSCKQPFAAGHVPSKRDKTDHISAPGRALLLKRSYYTMDQCRASANGQSCSPNPYYVGATASGRRNNRRYYRQVGLRSPAPEALGRQPQIFARGVRDVLSGQRKGAQIC